MVSLAEVKDGLSWYERYWRPCELVISDIEARGVPLDLELCPRKAVETQGEIDALTIQLRGWAGQDINWASPKQVAQFLYGTAPAAATKTGPVITPKGFDLPPVGGTLRAVQVRDEEETPTGGAALRYLADHAEDPTDREGLETLLEWKDRSKLRAFWEGLPKHAVNGRIHPQLGPNTETGRLSCKNPNLQQQPPDVREAFVAPEGYQLMELDYDALEWRILAHVLAHRGDSSLLDEVLAGIDPHSATAVRMGLCSGAVETVKEQNPKARADAKILNYSINYGKTGRGLGVQIRDRDGNPIGEQAGQALLDGFYKARPGIAKFHRDIITYAKANGYVRSLLGRRRYIPELQDERRWMQERGGRLAKNVIQNCATDIVVLAMLRVNTNPELESLGWYSKELAELDCQLILQIHDSLLFQVPTANAAQARTVAARLMETCLEGVRDFLCPLGVSGGFGTNWGACKGS